MAFPNPDICDNFGFENVGYCSCCNDVTALSSAINTCLDTDLSVINLSSQIDATATVEQSGRTDCSPILNSDMCASQFGFVLEAGTEFYDARALPSGVLGTNPVSNVGSFTTFSGAQVTSVSMLLSQTVITLAPWNDDSGSTTETAVSGAQSTGSAESTGSAQSTRGEGGSASSGASQPTGSLVLFGLVARTVACAWL